jgi:clan AA aspartic protease
VAITGTVVAGGREAIIPIATVGPHGRSAGIEAVIDTGFTGHLTLPSDLARSLDLPLLGTRYVTLANGATATLDVYRATVLWEGEERPVRAFAAEGAPLVGMALLHGSEVRLRVVEGGSVVIEPLS